MTNSYSNKKISLLYSGGCDSTLSASLLAKDFDEVHLVTFKHYSTWNVGRSRINAEKLRQKHKNVEFKHVFLNSSKLFLKIQKDFMKDKKDFKYFTLYVCGACKLAMHTELICYNLANDIKSASSGASHEMKMFPAQTRGGLSELERYYETYSMKLISPVYDKKNVDKEAVENGLMEERHLKSAHKADWKGLSSLYVPIKNMLDNIQGFCFWIAVVDSYNAIKQKKSTKANNEFFNDISDISQKYYKDKINNVCKKYIESKVVNK